MPNHINHITYIRSENRTSVGKHQGKSINVAKRMHRLFNKLPSSTRLSLRKKNISSTQLKTTEVEQKHNFGDLHFDKLSEASISKDSYIVKGKLDFTVSYKERLEFRFVEHIAAQQATQLRKKNVSHFNHHSLGNSTIRFLYFPCKIVVKLIIPR